LSRVLPKTTTFHGSGGEKQINPKYGKARGTRKKELREKTECRNRHPLFDQGEGSPHQMKANFKRGPNPRKLFGDARKRRLEKIRKRVEVAATGGGYADQKGGLIWENKKRRRQRRVSVRRERLKSKRGRGGGLPLILRRPKAKKEKWLAKRGRKKENPEKSAHESSMKVKGGFHPAVRETLPPFLHTKCNNVSPGQTVPSQGVEGSGNSLGEDNKGVNRRVITVSQRERKGPFVGGVVRLGEGKGRPSQERREQNVGARRYSK